MTSKPLIPAHRRQVRRDDRLRHSQRSRRRLPPIPHRRAGLANPPTALIQGDAVAEEITTLDGIEGVWAKIYRFQPAAKFTTWGPVMKQLVGKWYYVRIPLRIKPTRMLWWPGGDITAEPVEVPCVG